jgi:hypothetical protein
MNKRIAHQILQSLDKTASEIEKLSQAKLIDPKVAAEIISNIDTSADRIQIAAYGQAAFDAYQAKIAKVVKRDSDEPYMETFQNPIKPIKVDADEPYMHKAPGGFNSKDIGTFDVDPTTTVSDRDEYDVRDVSEFADGTKKQPTWPGGSSGKSTKQGAARSASTAKTWAP